jgi:hypothetical protein
MEDAAGLEWMLNKGEDDDSTLQTRRAKKENENMHNRTKRYIIVEIESIYRVIDVVTARLKGSYTDSTSADRAVIGFLIEDGALGPVCQHCPYHQHLKGMKSCPTP